MSQLGRPGRGPADGDAGDRWEPDRPVGSVPVPPDTYLTGILATHRARAAADGRDLEDLLDRAQSAAPTRPFTRSLAVPAGGELAVIAEVKRRSPSKGALDAGLDPAQVGRRLRGRRCRVRLGAHRRGVLRRVRPPIWWRPDRRCGLPVLRKDFTVSPADICDARLMGADAVLLIVAALSDAELSTFLEPGPASSRSTPWSRCTTKPSSTGPSTPGPSSSGSTSATSRRSRSMPTEPRVSVARIPPEVVAVAESGIRGEDDVRSPGRRRVPGRVGGGVAHPGPRPTPPRCGP